MWHSIGVSVAKLLRSLESRNNVNHFEIVNTESTTNTVNKFLV